MRAVGGRKGWHMLPTPAASGHPARADFGPVRSGKKKARVLGSQPDRLKRQASTRHTPTNWTVVYLRIRLPTSFSSVC